MGSQLQEFVKKFSPCQRTCSNRRNVWIMEGWIIESPLYMVYIGRASEKRRNICDFKEFMCFYS